MQQTREREGGIQRNDRQDSRKKKGLKKEKEKNLNTENEEKKERE